jgi:hypothetical protein
MSLLACALRLSGSTLGRPSCSSRLSLGEVVPMVPDLVSSLRVLDKRALIPVNQIFLLVVNLPSAPFDLEQLVSAS